MENEIKYKEAFAELQMIVSEIESGQISVDELSEKVKRATYLIKICKARLSETEDNVTQILKELDEGER